MAKARKPSKKRPAMSTGRGMVVTVSNRSTHDVAKDLKQAGFKVDQVLDAIGQVTGHATPGLKGRLKKIRGVDDVSETHQDFNIGPPDAPVS